jgi:hypothetical protein
VDDGSTVSAANAAALATIDQGTPGVQSVTGSSTIIIGTRQDGNPGVWAYSSGKMQGVIDEDSGTLSCVLPPSAENNGTFRGPWGWVYHVMGISKDGKIIIGYAENKKGFSQGKLQIDPGTTIGVYWRVSRHPVRPYLLASRAHIIGTLDLSKLKGSHGEFQRWANWIMKHILDQLKLFFLNYYTSYLIMVDKNGVNFDSNNNDYTVSGTDQDNNPAIATIDAKGNITITPVTQGSASVYVAGSYFNGSTNDVAALWKDNSTGLVSLYSNKEAIATSVFVSGNDVYVAGYYTNSKGNLAATYWKNGTQNDLYSDTTGAAQAQANSIYLAGTDVYAAGYIGPAGSKVAGYWKNGTWVPFTAPGSAQATGIVVSGSNVYVSGYYLSGVFDASCYWTNGSITTLYSAGDSEALGLSVSGSNVYVAGYYRSGSFNAAYWLNNSSNVTTLNSSAAFASGIVVSGGNVYTSGYYRNGSGNQAACYWTNTTKTDLYSDATGTATAQANGIFISGTDICVAGWVNTGTQSACYWKNGTQTNLYTSNTSSANAVFAAN